MKLIAPNKDETPAKCKLKIAKSTLPPECACIPDKGMAVKFIIKIHKINIKSIGLLLFSPFIQF